MSLHKLPALVVVLGFLVTLISGDRVVHHRQADPPQPTGTTSTIDPLLNNPAYWAEVRRPTEDNWDFIVWSDGLDVIHNNEPVPVDRLSINTDLKRLTVYEAWNGVDKAQPRLKMRNVFFALWQYTGLAPSEVKEVLGHQVNNEEMHKGIAACRVMLGITIDISFTLAAEDTEKAKLDCWALLDNTPFGGAIRASIEDFAVGKKLIKIQVDHGGVEPDDWNHVFYTFSDGDAQR